MERKNTGISEMTYKLKVPERGTRTLGYLRYLSITLKGQGEFLDKLRQLGYNAQEVKEILGYMDRMNAKDLSVHYGKVI